ncbi:MAG: L,D-transpeptidase [Hyphomicrobiaceae bacterium]
MKRPNTRWLLAAAALTMLGFAAPETANAQQDSGWAWGGGSTPGGSGREVIRFSPQHAPGQIIVSFGDRRLYHVVRQGEAVSYPIAIPRDQSRWQGVTSVTQKRENPSWTPTPTMRAENPRLPMWVPGGHPMNPLGVRALYLGSSAYRIHGTDAPWTIGAAVSKGCIRMYNQDVIDLYPRVAVGTKVTVTWQTFRGEAVAARPGPAPYGEQRQPRRRVAAAAVDDTPPTAEQRPTSERKPLTKRSTVKRVRSAEVTE